MTVWLAKNKRVECPKCHTHCRVFKNTVKKLFMYGCSKCSIKFDKNGKFKERWITK